MPSHNASSPPARSTLAPPRCMVAQVTWSLVAGGSEMYAYTIASHLDPDRFSCVLCAVDQGGALEDEIRRAGIPAFIMHRRPGIDLRMMWRLYKLFRKLRVQVIQTHHFNQLFYSLPGARLLGVRIIHTEHDVELVKRPRLCTAMKLMSRCCYRMVAIGTDIAAMFRDELGIPATKIEIVRAGVNLEAYHEDRAAARTALGLHAEDRVAVIVARLFPEKNHKLLLAAFAEVAPALADARLLIVGEGVERDAIRAEIARLGLDDRVQMLGVRRDIPTILAASDVFVLASDREGLPIAVLEAMAAARPIVATRVGDLPAVVEDGATGYLVAPGDGNALATALTTVLGDSAAAECMGAAAREVAQRYSLRAMIDRYETLYSA